MKKYLLLVSFLVIGHAWAQVNISIIAGKKCSVRVESVPNGDAEINKLIIRNEFGKNKCSVVLSQPESGTVPFNISFGDQGKSDLAAGDNTFRFNASGIIDRYPDTKQTLHSPCRLKILDAGAKLLFDTTFSFKPEQTKGPGRDTATFTSARLTKIAYYDALALADYHNLGMKQFREILNYYRFKPDTIANDNQRLIDEFKGNDFLYTEFQKMLKDEEWNRRVVSVPSLDLSGLSLGSIGGLDVTNIADGFARFIVRRAKTELNVAFFDKFRTEISKPEYRDMQTLFPQTYRALDAIGEEIYNYDAYIQTLRECFEKDLASLLTNMPKVITNHPEFFDRQPELKAILLSAFYVGQQLQDKQNPGEIIANYPDTVWKSSNPNYRAAIQTLKLVSTSLRNNDVEKGYWVTADDLKLLVTNDKAFRIYIGLLIQVSKNEDIKFSVKGKETRLADVLNNSFKAMQSDIPAISAYITTFIQKTGAISSMIRNFKKTGSDSLLLENYYSLFSSVIDLMKYSTNVESLPRFPQTGLKAKTDQYLDAAQTTADIVIDVNRRNYSSAVVNAHHLYTTVFSAKNVEKPLGAIRAEEEKSAESYSTQIKELDKLKKQREKEKDPALKDTLDNRIAGLEDELKPYLDLNLEYLQLDKINDVLKAIYKYGSFMASVVAAKTSDDVAKAIEAAALPAGSSRIKRETKFNVSLNAYLGLFAGYEQIRDFDTTGFRINSFGVSAPIGVAVSRGHSLFFIGTGKSGWSTSAFVSVVDIGAIAAFRVKDDSTSQVPTIQLQDILSPGVFISIGVPKCPLSVNFGVQMGPNLRTVTSTMNSYSNSIYLRYSMSVVVDIPIFNFYSKSR